MARCIETCCSDETPQFALSFGLTASKRKRPVGQPLRWRDHRQAVTALKAEASGYQLKRGARKPLLDTETEPGVAIAWALAIPHPLCVEVELDDLLKHTITQVARQPTQVRQHRQAALAHWRARAVQLLPQSDALLAAQPDPALRSLLRGGQDHEPLQLGRCCHVALYYEMLQACNSVDAFLPDLLLQGFPIVGPIARSSRWPAYEKSQPQLPVQYAIDRAWGIRSKIIARVRGVPISENLTKIWEATLEDVAEGSTLGPFATPEEVTSLLGNDGLDTYSALRGRPKEQGPWL